MRPSVGRCAAAATLVVLLSALAPAGRAQEQRLLERQVLDPNTGQWVDQAAPADEVPAEPVDQARYFLAHDQPDKARAVLKKWQKGKRDDERYYESVYLLGDAYYEGKDFWKALQQYEIVAENAAGELYELANRRCVDVARAFLSGQKRIVWGFLRLPAYSDGVDILQRVWERCPGTRLGELALKLKAEYHYNDGDVDFAQDDYNQLATQFPKGRYAQLAMLRSAQASEAAFSGIRYDDRPLVEATERYEQFQSAYPTYATRESTPARLEGIRQQRAEKDLYIARWYERTSQPSAAEFYYRQILKDWPDTIAAADARARLRALGAAVDEPAAEGKQP